jgi:hypothetical protein
VRLLSPTLAALLAALLPHKADATTALDVYVTARLASLVEGPGCGLFLVGSSAMYEVISGPHELQGRTIEVIIPCVELSRGKFSTNSGDLDSFQIGKVHFLALSRSNVHKIEYLAATVSSEAYFLRAVSLSELRSNISLERTRER